MSMHAICTYSLGGALALARHFSQPSVRASVHSCSRVSAGSWLPVVVCGDIAVTTTKNSETWFLNFTAAAAEAPPVGALPPVGLRAVCFVRAMMCLETVGCWTLLDVRLLKRPLGVYAEVLCGGCWFVSACCL